MGRLQLLNLNILFLLRHLPLILQNRVIQANNLTLQLLLILIRILLFTVLHYAPLIVLNAVHIIILLMLRLHKIILMVFRIRSLLLQYFLSQ